MNGWILGKDTVYLEWTGFPCGSAGKESASSVGDLGLIPGLGRPPEEGKGYPLQYSGLENSMDRIAHGVVESRTWLSDFHFTSSSRMNIDVLIIQLFPSGATFFKDLTHMTTTIGMFSFYQLCFKKKPFHLSHRGSPIYLIVLHISYI